MNDTDWTTISGKLKAAGFAVFYNRISYEPEHPLWCAKASRGDQQWTTMGRELGAAFVELEKQTQEANVDWRAIMALERDHKHALSRTEARENVLHGAPLRADALQPKEKPAPFREVGME